MNIEEQVCSFEMAEQLKNLGVTQDSYFRWLPAVASSDTPSLMPKSSRGKYPTAWQYGIAAFTTSELATIVVPAMYMLEKEGAKLEPPKVLTEQIDESVASMYKPDWLGMMLVYLIEQHKVEA